MKTGEEIDRLEAAVKEVFRASAAATLMTPDQRPLLFSLTPDGEAVTLHTSRHMDK
jgi:hypothetical protein